MNIKFYLEELFNQDRQVLFLDLRSSVSVEHSCWFCFGVYLMAAGTFYRGSSSFNKFCAYIHQLSQEVRNYFHKFVSSVLVPVLLS